MKGKIWSNSYARVVEVGDSVFEVERRGMFGWRREYCEYGPIVFGSVAEAEDWIRRIRRRDEQQREGGRRVVREIA